MFTGKVESNAPVNPGVKVSEGNWMDGRGNDYRDIVDISAKNSFENYRNTGLNVGVNVNTNLNANISSNANANANADSNYGENLNFGFNANI